MAKNVVVIGTQWGDEGKGKIVDWLTDHAAVGCSKISGRSQCGPHACYWARCKSKRIQT